jgi:hypothetical protein
VTVTVRKPIARARRAACSGEQRCMCHLTGAHARCQQYRTEPESLSQEKACPQAGFLARVNRFRETIPRRA